MAGNYARTATTRYGKARFVARARQLTSFGPPPISRPSPRPARGDIFVVRLAETRKVLQFQNALVGPVRLRWCRRSAVNDWIVRPSAAGYPGTRRLKGFS